MNRTPVKQQDGNVGAEVRAARHARGLTQGELAEAAGLALETVSRVELGQTRPTLRTLTQLAEALQLELRSLFAGAEGHSAQQDRGRGRAKDSQAAKARSPEMSRLLAILPQLQPKAVRHLLGIARLLLSSQKKSNKSK